MEQRSNSANKTERFGQNTFNIHIYPDVHPYDFDNDGVWLLPLAIPISCLIEAPILSGMQLPS